MTESNDTSVCAGKIFLFENFAFINAEFQCTIISCFFKSINSDVLIMKILYTNINKKYFFFYILQRHKTSPINDKIEILNRSVSTRNCENKFCFLSEIIEIL